MRGFPWSVDPSGWKYVFSAEPHAREGHAFLARTEARYAGGVILLRA